MIIHLFKVFSILFDRFSQILIIFLIMNYKRITNLFSFSEQVLILLILILFFLYLYFTIHFQNIDNKIFYERIATSLVFGITLFIIYFYYDFILLIIMMIFFYLLNFFKKKANYKILNILALIILTSSIVILINPLTTNEILLIFLMRNLINFSQQIFLPFFPKKIFYQSEKIFESKF